MAMKDTITWGLLLAYRLIASFRKNLNGRNYGFNCNVISHHIK